MLFIYFILKILGDTKMKYRNYFFAIFILLILIPVFSFAQDVESLIEKGYQLAYNGNYGSAIKQYDKAIKIDPASAKAYYNRANVKYDLRDYEGAIEDCSKAIQLDPELKNAYFNLGISKFQLEKYKESITDFDKAIELNPSDAETLCWRGIAKHKLGKTDEACEDWNKARNLGFSYVNMYLKYCQEENSIDTGSDGGLK